MKKLKGILVIILTFMLVSCGIPNLEGTYVAKENNLEISSVVISGDTLEIQSFGSTIAKGTIDKSAKRVKYILSGFEVEKSYEIITNGIKMNFMGKELSYIKK